MKNEKCRISNTFGIFRSTFNIILIFEIIQKSKIIVGKQKGTHQYLSGCRVGWIESWPFSHKKAWPCMALLIKESMDPVTKCSHKKSWPAIFCAISKHFFSIIPRSQSECDVNNHHNHHQVAITTKYKFPQELRGNTTFDKFPPTSSSLSLSSISQEELSMWVDSHHYYFLSLYHYTLQ